jgi:hypothetical protein
MLVGPKLDHPLWEGQKLPKMTSYARLYALQGHVCQVELRAASQRPVSASNPSVALNPRQPGRIRPRRIAILNHQSNWQQAIHPWRSPSKIDDDFWLRPELPT